MEFSYSNRLSDVPILLLDGRPIERVQEQKYLGVILQANPSRWASHCGAMLKKARRVFYVYRNFYRKGAPDSVLLTIHRAIIRSILEYCGDLYLPSAYFAGQFERLQKLVVRTYMHDFEMEYVTALLNCNLDPLTSRRGASVVVSLMKYYLSAHFMLPGFFVHSACLGGRRSTRGDRFRDLVLVRNFPSDASLIPFQTF